MKYAHNMKKATATKHSASPYLTVPMANKKSCQAVPYREDKWAMIGWQSRQLTILLKSIFSRLISSQEEALPLHFGTDFIKMFGISLNLFSFNNT